MKRFLIETVLLSSVLAGGLGASIGAMTVLGSAVDASVGLYHGEETRTAVAAQAALDGLLGVCLSTAVVCAAFGLIRKMERTI